WISDDPRKGRPPEDDHNEAEWPEQRHDLQLLVARHHFVGLDGEEHEHEDGAECLRIGNEGIVMCPDGIFHLLQEVHHTFFVYTVALQKIEGFLEGIRDAL